MKKFSEITLNELTSVIDLLNKNQIDFGDIYCQQARYERLTLDEQVVKKSFYSELTGCGIRAVCADKTGFAYTHNFENKDMLKAARIACEIRNHIKNDKLKIEASSLKAGNLYPQQFKSKDVESQKELLLRLDKYARKKEPAIIDCNISIASAYEEIKVADNLGFFQSDNRPMLRFSIQLIVEKNKKRESGHSGMGGRYGYTEVDESSLYTMVDLAIEEALLNLESKPAPSGAMPVVLGNGWPGIMLHEAVGHALEADFNRKQISVFSNKIGTPIASKLCTVVDNGAIEGKRGSLHYDDEGTAGKKNILVENGVLKQYMQDKLNARLMKTALTGNGRRESFAHLPMPRMTNTYLENGKSTPAEIIQSVSKGIYAKTFSGGQVDITSGNFVFNTSQAWLIENGKLTTPIKGATLTGNGPEVMNLISMVGNDLALDPGIGVCGKDGQSVPVCVGQPTLKVDSLVVGGTSL